MFPAIQEAIQRLKLEEGDFDTHNACLRILQGVELSLLAKYHPVPYVAITPSHVRGPHTPVWIFTETRAYGWQAAGGLCECFCPGRCGPVV